MSLIELIKMRFTLDMEIIKRLWFVYLAIIVLCVIFFFWNKKGENNGK